MMPPTPPAKGICPGWGHRAASPCVPSASQCPPNVPCSHLCGVTVSMTQPRADGRTTTPRVGCDGWAAPKIPSREPRGCHGQGHSVGIGGGTEGWQHQGEGRAAAVPTWHPTTPRSTSRIRCHPAEEDYGNFPPPLRIIFRLGCGRGCAERLGDGNVICDSIISSRLPAFFFFYFPVKPSSKYVDLIRTITARGQLKPTQSCTATSRLG